MAKIKRYTEDEARENGFSEADIATSRKHPEGYLGTSPDGSMCFNTQVDIAMGDINPGAGRTAAVPDEQGEGFPAGYRRSKQ